MTYMLTIDGNIAKEDLQRIIVNGGIKASVDEVSAGSLQRLADFAGALEEVKHHKEGKIELQSLDEFLDEV
jgi:hypothetical protein